MVLSSFCVSGVNFSITFKSRSSSTFASGAPFFSFFSCSSFGSGSPSSCSSSNALGPCVLPASIFTLPRGKNPVLLRGEFALFAETTWTRFCFASASLTITPISAIKISFFCVIFFPVLFHSLILYYHFFKKQIIFSIRRFYFDYSRVSCGCFA